MKQQSGFTLIELVMVIVILGILAATALPKFVDLKGEAQQAAVQAVAGALTSGGNINYALRSISSAAGFPVSSAAATGCAAAASGIEGGIPTGHTLDVSGTSTTTLLSCKVTDANSKAAGYSMPVIP